ncbi:MAG: HIT family protein [Phycisphaerales bacterium]|nr:HIT family protein [Planctomycetota bacterium]MBL6997108.1 HIT family protein [Phycisphaerales bacterium]
MQTIFQKIINGDIQCHRVYENDHVLAFLDVAPLCKGHTLVIPKESVASLHDLSIESGAALGEALVKVARAVVKATGCEDYNILQNNGEVAHQAVFHVHFHIIPKVSESEGLALDWNPKELEDGESLAQKIRDAMA